jgi:hypothetical protein
MVGYFGPLFLLPKTYRWGGGIMSTAGRYVGSFGERTQKAVEPGLKGWADRYQGRKANQYDLQASKFGVQTGRKKLFGKRGPPIRPYVSLNGRAWRRMQSGHMLPNERSRRLTLAQGEKYAGERNDEAGAYVRALGESAATNGYRYKNAKGEWEHARDDDGNIMKGVAGQKAAYNDIAGNEYSSEPQQRAARQAVTRLLDTSSWIELQEAKIRTGPNAGRRVVELPAFRDQLLKRPEDYGRVIGPRPDFAPDVIEGAQKEVAVRHNVNAEDIWKMPELQNEIDFERMNSSLDRLKAGDVPGLHRGYFQDIAKLNSPKLSGKLAAKLEEFQKLGGVEGQRATSALLGGTEKYAIAALQPAGRTVKGIIKGKEPEPGEESSEATSTETTTTARGNRTDDEPPDTGSRPAPTGPRPGGGPGNFRPGGESAGTAPGGVVYSNPAMSGSMAGSGGEIRISHESAAEIGRAFAQQINPTIRDLGEAARNQPPPPPPGWAERPSGLATPPAQERSQSPPPENNNQNNPPQG